MKTNKNINGYRYLTFWRRSRYLAIVYASVAKFKIQIQVVREIYFGNKINYLKVTVSLNQVKKMLNKDSILIPKT